MDRLRLAGNDRCKPLRPPPCLSDIDRGALQWTNEDTGLKLCTPTCSGGLVNVAMEHAGCSGGGAKARCCKPNYKTTSTRYQNSEDYQFEDALRNFMTNPVCMSNIFVASPLRKRNESLAVDMDHQSVGLVPRQDAGYRTFVIESLVLFMAQRLFVETPRRSLIDIWDRTVVTRFNSLSYANLADYQRRRGHALYVMYGSTQWPRYITCNLGVLQEAIAGTGGGGGGGSCTRTCECVREDCCTPDNSACVNAASGDQLQKRTNAEIYHWTAIDPHSTASQYLPWRGPEVRLPSPSSSNKARTDELKVPPGRPGHESS